MSDSLAWISLASTPGLGLKGLWNLIEYFETPDAVFQAGAAKLKKAGVRPRGIAGLASVSTLQRQAEKELNRLAEMGGSALCFSDPSYPALLACTHNPPPVLYVQGDVSLLDKAAVAIVGSRAATSYGRRVARKLGADLGRSSLTVVSGLALGVDTEAHAGALSSEGKTIAVLGCGLNVVYPSQNRKLFAEIREKGALVSEYPLGARPEAFHFPARNRIIAGLCSGVVVVEAARKSGSLITAQLALDEGRDVYAVPGQVDSSKSHGAHWLLQQGAKLVGSVQDILEDLPGKTLPQPSDGRGQEKGLEDLEPDGRSLLAHFDTYPCSRDSVIQASGLGPGRVSELLLLLELDGFIELLPGDQVRRV